MAPSTSPTPAPTTGAPTTTSGPVFTSTVTQSFSMGNQDVSDQAAVDTLLNAVASEYGIGRSDVTVTLQKKIAGQMTITATASADDGIDWICDALKVALFGATLPSYASVDCSAARRRLAAGDRTMDYTTTIDLTSPAAITAAADTASTVTSASGGGGFAALDAALPAGTGGFTGATAPTQTVDASVAIVVSASSQAALDTATASEQSSLPTASALSTGIGSTLGTAVTVTGVTTTIVDDPPPAGSGSSDSGDSGLGGGAIAGIVIGALAGVALIGLAVWWVMLKQGAAKKGEDFSTKTTQHV